MRVLVIDLKQCKKKCAFFFDKKIPNKRVFCYKNICLPLLGMVLITPAKFRQQFDLWKLDNIFLFIWRPFCETKRNVPAICTPKDCIDQSCEVSSKSNQQFDLWKQVKCLFLIITLEAILCGETEHACDNHNLGLNTF
jgi:hypothetical protein